MAEIISVHVCPDIPADLREQLQAIVDNGGRIINVMWQPERIVEYSSTPDGSAHVRKIESGYAIVSGNNPEPL